jgi:hypothetical protein
MNLSKILTEVNMKQIMFTLLFTFVFCLTIFAQEVSCEKQPVLVADYPNSSPNSHKDLMDSFRHDLANNPKCVGTIRIQAKKNSEIFRQYNKIFKYFAILRISLEPIKLAIVSNSENEKVEFWSSLPSAEIPNCEECIIIRAKDFPKIEALFKPAIKKRKK